MKPQRIQRQRKKGWRMPANTISVTRPGRWGNPFPCGGDKVAAVKAYKEWLFEGMNIWAGHPPTPQEIRTSLKGKNLACWCRVGEPCHGDVLIEIANTR